jgi:nucleoside 2-deoxyribosyltransferase
MTKRVFISSTHLDAKLAARVESELERLGLDAVNATREIEPGEDWRKTIKQAIKRADAVIMLMASPQRATSSWMSYEAGVAEALGKHLMVLIPNNYSVSELPAEVTVSHVVNFDPQAPEDAARDIAEYLRAA